MKFHLLISFIVIFLIGCSASTGSRYETKEEKKTETKSSEESKTKVTEDFDITPYETEINIQAPPIGTDKLPPDVWYGYKEDTTSVLQRKIVGTTDGYRVQVISTDDIDEANRVRAEIYEKTAHKEVYVTFEPPFYKVKAGDFITKTDANNFKFELNQLGYSEAKVVQETVNVFEQ